jgi:hypothetical protein
MVKNVFNPTGKADIKIKHGNVWLIESMFNNFQQNLLQNSKNVYTAIYSGC